MADREMVGIHNFSFFVEKFSDSTTESYNLWKN